MKKERKLYFKEEQKFDQWWLKLLMITVFVASVIPIIYLAVDQVVFGKVHGNNPMSNTGIIIFTIAIVLIIGFSTMLVFLLKLKTEIRNDGIHISFKPFVKHRFIKKEDILSWEVRKYNPVKEFGGWGYRFGTKKNGDALNVKGDKGLQLYLKNFNKKLLIGTQRPDAIKRAMKKLMADTNNEQR